MTLQRRREAEIVPSYSLTGDLLSFLRCGLQYRYHSGSALPPSRPVQLWFGEFIHGVLESAYRIWSASDPVPAFPWPCNQTPFPPNTPLVRVPHDIGEIGERVEAVLRAQGKSARSRSARNSAYKRVEATINLIAPDLFPLVSRAEERVIGTRKLQSSGNLRARRYELHGVIDVLTSVELGSAGPSNVIREAVAAACPQLPNAFEVVVDYKGTRRPALDSDFWMQTAWQVQTYGWLRSKQPNSLPVAAGILIYVNELSPNADDIRVLKQEAASGNTDIVPQNGSSDAYKLSVWQPGSSIPDLSLAFRLARAIRVVPVDQASQEAATVRFDTVVTQIEGCVAAEAAGGSIKQNWSPNGDEATCIACDFRHFCPSPYATPRLSPKPISSPSAP